MGLGLAKVGRQWAHYREETRGGETTATANPDDPNYMIKVPLDAIEATDPIYLSPYLKDLYSTKLHCFSYSIFNEFTYSLGVLLYHLMCGHSDITATDNLNTIGRQGYFSSSVVRLVKELMCDKSSRRMSFVTLGRVSERLM